MAAVPEVRMHIGGERVAAEQTYDVHDPATGEVLAKVAKGTKEHAAQAVEAAQNAAERGDWVSMEASQRGRTLYKLATLVRERIAELAELETRNNGKTIRESKGDVTYVAWTLEYFAGLADKLQGDTIPVPGPRFNYTLREPLGVTVHIAPWNYPLLLSVRSLAPALAAGNTAVLKPASLTPLTALRFAELGTEAGLPPGVLNVVTGPGGAVGEALATHAAVEAVSFTGSVDVGKRVGELAMGRGKSVTLELGGKSPMLVFPDANPEKVSKAVQFGIFANAGQMCWASSRLLIHEKAHDEVVGRVKKLAEALKLGPGVREDTQMGPLVSRSQQESVLGFIEKGKAEGAKLLTGGSPPMEKELAMGSFVKPTVFSDVQPDMTIAREEIFGPVLSVLRFRDADDAVRLANQSRFGLHASVYTNDLSTALKTAGALRTGMVSINEGPISFPMTPFGGEKESGVGRAQGIQAAYAYTRVKNVTVRV